MNKERSDQIMEQGRQGEEAFRKWLTDCNAPFMYVEQSPENYSTLFSNKIKRPDFLLLVTGMGLLAVDVKHFSTTRSGGFTISIDKDLVYAMEFEHSFRLYLWYAIKDVRTDDAGWNFISAYDAIQHGEIKQNGKDGSSFVEIDPKHFTVLTDAQRLDMLFRRRLGISGMLTRRFEEFFRKIPNSTDTEPSWAS